MISNHHRIVRFVEQGYIPSEKMDQALTISGVYPDAAAWRSFINHLLLWLGGLALAFAVLFFVAYNWSELGRLFRFALVEVLIVAAIIVYWKLGTGRMAGKVALLGGTICLGVLLALYGQTYQTGADPWQLFFNWALLILPWVVIGRFAPLWLVWLALINISISLYFRAFPNAFDLIGIVPWNSGVYWVLFLFNTLALTLWELAARRWSFMAQRWAIRLVALGSGYAVTWLALISILANGMSDRAGLLSGLIWLLWLAGMGWVYRYRIRDLFMLTGCCLSAIVVMTTLLARYMLEGDPVGAFLLLALMVMGAGSGSLVWLKRLHREWQA
ncbi:DUF2157 domain-containing protein [Thiohalophilus thiocyanatoxydans]|uniref:Putative membrane protein DUF2157 n=1 Tax=Thiohalophilus thiocyanatoxydans TaxID=381308 RepID=A0A4R8IR22_9GAMM|nr:DUF2157 domain-containing protein [Thiohalophilus thiocyanatoxydans]TDY00007.1 putative membrane protein DUF2157 [Thiohalophilus thiocyanatoxydans]